KLAAPRPAPVPEGGQDGERAEVPAREVGVRVAEAGRRRARLGHEQRVAGERLERRAVARVVAIRTVEPEARHAYADDVGPEPTSARMRVATGPATTQVKSSTRTPSSGRIRRPPAPGGWRARRP